jgi:hypothetical protein
MGAKPILRLFHKNALRGISEPKRDGDGENYIAMSFVIFVLPSNPVRAIT